MTRGAATLLFAVLGLGCRSTAEQKPLATGDAACASACAALVTRCPADEPTDARQAACVESCRDAAAKATRAGCNAEHRSYLSCVSTARVECSTKAAAGSALEHGLGAPDCRPLHAAYFACTEPCREQGVVRTGVARLPLEGREVDARAELVVVGCAEPLPSKAKGASPGSRCTHHTVCAAERCDCARGRPGYHARACVDDRCAAPRVACELAPLAVGYRPCR